jgi:hypothetical protein
MLYTVITLAVASVSAIIGFLISSCLHASRNAALAGRLEGLSALAAERDELINQMALAIRNVALLLTDDGRDTRDIVAIISHTETMLNRRLN